MKKAIKNFHINLFKNRSYVNDKRTFYIGLVVFYLTLLSTFFTIIGQIPKFSAAGITKYFQIGWIVLIFFLIILDYKQFTRSFITVFLIGLPFFLYLLILLPFNINSIYYQGTTYILICLFIFLEGMVLGKFFNFNFLKGFAVSYVLSALIYAFFVYIERLRGHVGDTEIYAFNDKNSAGPIFLIAALLPFFLFQKNKPIFVILKILTFCGFMLILLLAKCRATVVFAPFAVLLMHLFLPKTKAKKIISTSLVGALMIIGIIIIFSVPYLYQRIIVHFIFNDKKTIEDMFSGRIQQIRNAFIILQDTKILFFGNGGLYIDCMPISFLTTYGIVGVLTFIPILIIPIYSTIRSKKYLNHRGTFFTINLIILCLLYFNGMFEGLGFIGTGTKVFALWILSGYSYCFIIEDQTCKHVCTIVDKPALFCSKIKPKTFSFVFSFAFITATTGLLISKNTVNYVGEKIFEILPLSKKTAPITTAKSFSIDKNFFYTNLGSMCVGQKITFRTVINPINAIDTKCDFQYGWSESDAIKIIDKNKGLVEAVRSTPKGPTILCCHFPTRVNAYSIQFRINEQQNYDFTNKVCIDVNPITYSFETLDKYSNGEINITIKKGMTAKAYYDSFCYPINNDFKFISSDSNIASIDSSTGIIKANNVGTCTISGEGTKGIRKFNSRNKINVTVEKNDDSFEPVEKIALKTNLKIYQYQPIKFSDYVLFNSNASDKHFDVTFSGLTNDDYVYNSNTDEYTFKKAIPSFDVKVVSRSNQEKSFTKSLSIISNKPTKITCDNNWIVVGQKYDVTQLGLKLWFENGYWKYLEDADLSYDVHQATFKCRVSASSTGFCDGKLTSIQGVKSGRMTYTYVCAYDNNIKATMTFRSSIYTYPQYVKMCTNIGLIVAFILIAICSFFLFGLKTKNKFIYILFAVLFSATTCIVTMLIYEMNQYSIGCLIAFISLLFIISIIRLTAMKNKPLNLIDSIEDNN